MADLYPGLELGDAYDESQCEVFNAKCAAIVTKGQVVIFNTHTAGEIPSVSPAGAAAANCLGLALQAGVIGDTIKVLRRGIAKATAAGAITGGVTIVSGAAGTIATVGANTFEKAIGRALQTFADTDTGLAFFDF